MRELIARMLGSPSAWFRYHKRRTAHHMERMGFWRSKLPQKSCGAAKIPHGGKVR